MERIDDAYETKMVAFEIDCNDGKGEPIACHHAAEYFALVKEEYNKAAKIYQMNCYNKNYGPSCFNLARYHLAGKGVEQSDPQAEKLFETACTGQHLQACYFQALMLYTNGFKTVNSPKTANIDQDSTAISTTTTSSSLTEIKSPAQIEIEKVKKGKALKLFEWACDQGENDSCYFVGSHYLKKDNPERDPIKSIEHLERGCRTNHAPSCYNLAVLYKNGDTGVPQNNEQFEKYKELTTTLVQQYGGLSGTRTG